MFRILKTATLLILIVILWSCSRQKQNQPEEVVKNEFLNPILAGFYPDPSICKVNDNYYLITSSFSYFPGIPIFKSSDLVNWEQLGHIMDRPSQLDTEGQRISRGLFAPTITYHDGTYYVTSTHIDKGGNFIVTASDPAGPWSDPHWLSEVEGIDPSLFIDNGKMYVIYNSTPPENQPLYEGHRTIRMREINQTTLKAKEKETILVNGGTDLSKKPVWIEGPHLYKINNFYYLMCAEGGTAYNHSEVVFRSKKITGPYEPWDQNPILTQRQLDPSRSYPVTTTGHADMVQTDNGEWWAVFLGCRPYGDNYYNIGRETFLAPVEWKDGWPVINPDFEEVQYSYPTPYGNGIDTTDFPYNGNFKFTDEFKEDTLAMHYVFLRTPKEKWYNLQNDNLTMKVRSESASGLSNPSFIGHRQQHHKGSAATSLDFQPGSVFEKAGLIAFQSENNYYLLCKTTDGEKDMIALYASTTDSLRLLESAGIPNTQPVELKITFDRSKYSFYYATLSGNWQLLKDNVDGTFLSTKVAGGFVGSVIAMYATSHGNPSTNTATFHRFEYKGDDDVYRDKAFLEGQ